MLEASTDHKYKCIAVSASDNPPILSGKQAHGGVALFWKQTLNDFVTPLDLKNIDSDRIVGIRCDLNNSVPLFILSVYLPSSDHNIDDYDEYLDYLWALYDSLSAKGIVVAMGDFNGDLGNALGDRGTVNPNQRGVKLLDFANYFNLCPTNLLSTCEGPLETYFSHCERYKSTTDYIFFPNCLYHSIVSCITFDRDIENTLDHVPVKLQVEVSTDMHINTINDTNSYSGPKLKVNWSKFSQEEIEKNYTLFRLIWKV